MKILFTFTLATSLAAALMAAGQDGFKSIFNGKDLSSWEGNPKLWSVENGAITGKTSDEGETRIKHNTFLIWKGGTVADFELRLQYRIVKGNSGIQYRSKKLSDGEFGPIVGGYQADFEAGKTYSGILYEERGRGILALRGQKTVVKPEIEVEQKGKKVKKADVQVVGEVGKSEEIQAAIKDEQWNDYRIVARGNHLQHFINGKQTVDVTDEDSDKAAKDGILALQIHVGPAMVVQFKDIQLKELGRRSDIDLMQGEWTPAEIQANGEALDRSDFEGISIRISGQSYTMTTKDGGDHGTFEVNTSQSPAWMDVTNKDGRVIRAIYEISGDKWRVCYSLSDSGRPDAFATSQDSGRVYAVYQRR